MNEEVEDFFIIDKKTNRVRRLDPGDPSDVELIQEHKDAIRHGIGVELNVDEKKKLS